MIYEELKGLITINSIDIYSQYHAFLCESKDSEFTNYEALLKPSATKTNTAVNIREKAGEDLPSDLQPQNDARDFVLFFAIHGDGESDFYTKYTNFISFLKTGLNGTGWLDIKLTDLPTAFHVHVKDCSDYKNLTAIDVDLVAAQFKITFHEPKPFI